MGLEGGDHLRVLLGNKKKAQAVVEALKWANAMG